MSNLTRELTWSLPFGTLVRIESRSIAPESLGSWPIVETHYELRSDGNELDLIIPRAYALALIHTHATEEL